MENYIVTVKLNKTNEIIRYYAKDKTPDKIIEEHNYVKNSRHLNNYVLTMDLDVKNITKGEIIKIEKDNKMLKLKRFEVTVRLSKTDTVVKFNAASESLDMLLTALTEISETGEWTTVLISKDIKLVNIAGCQILNIVELEDDVDNDQNESEQEPVFIFTSTDNEDGNMKTYKVTITLRESEGSYVFKFNASNEKELVYKLTNDTNTVFCYNKNDLPIGKIILKGDNFKIKNIELVENVVDDNGNSETKVNEYKAIVKLENGAINKWTYSASSIFEVMDLLKADMTPGVSNDFYVPLNNAEILSISLVDNDKKETDCKKDLFYKELREAIELFLPDFLKLVKQSEEVLKMEIPLTTGVPMAVVITDIIKLLNNMKDSNIVNMLAKELMLEKLDKFYSNLYNHTTNISPILGGVFSIKIPMLDFEGMDDKEQKSSTEEEPDIMLCGPGFMNFVDSLFFKER